MPDKSILPPNATKYQRALEKSVRAMLADIKVPLRNLWNPEKCPAGHLPWLAWTMSVDEWDSNWPEQAKRKAIQESFLVHKQKGTVSSIKRVLKAIGVPADVEEWWQQEPKGVPYTFSLNVPVNDNELLKHNGTVEQLKRMVYSTKPARSQYTVELGFNQNMNLKKVCQIECDKTIDIHFTVEIDECRKLEQLSQM